MKKAEGSEIEIARDSLWSQSWPMFAAWEEAQEFWLNEDGEVIAYLRTDEKDTDGIAFFEVRDKGQGVGAAIIAELRAEGRDLYISGDIDSSECARFWVRMGFDVDGMVPVAE